ncbi:phage tail family protein [Metabacillus sp. 84]|uniref:phage tail family protein n=1 Tax=Metabacillus sp. 84 TaxID=3404705 RepID=UPI003CE6EA12
MIILKDLNNQEIDLQAYGLTCLSFIPESLSPSFQEENNEYTDGTIIAGTKINSRILKTKFWMKAADHVDYQMLRDEIYRLFDPRKQYFIIDKRQPGKRWIARNSTLFTPEYINPKTGQFELNFFSEKPYAQSIGSTLNLFTFDSNLWQVGQGLVLEDVSYIHETTTFRIFNAGTEVVNPERNPLIIRYTGPSDNLEIRNLSTLDTWKYHKTTVQADTLEINRTRSLKNGVNVFNDTNRGLISLDPGWNEFKLSGTSGSFEISFDFRFYYV